MRDTIDRFVLLLLSRPATLKAALFLRRLVAAFGYEKGFVIRFSYLMDRLGRLIDPSPLRAETNLHTERLATLVRRPVATRETARRPPRDFSPGDRWRVAIYGSFSGALGFGPSFFAAVPKDIDLYIFDHSWRDAYAENLATTGHFYHQIDRSTEGLIKAAAIANEKKIDIFCNINYKADPRLLAALDAPCVTTWCSGSSPYFGDLVDFNLYPQYHRYYRLTDQRLVHSRTGVSLPGSIVYPSFWTYDPREGNDPAAQPIARREKTIFFHGSLYKLANSDYLDMLFRVMADIPDAKFAFMGKQMWNDELSLIEERARHWGVADRVENFGTYENTRGEGGEIADQRWQLCRRLLREARLWLSTFPGIGASARIEAFQAGAAVVQMCFPADWQNGKVPVYNAWELPYLRVEQGAATTPAEYEALMRRVLLDDAFAQSLVDQQYAQLPEMLDQARIWQDLKKSYADWKRQVEAI
jgi:hypothetical protein